MTAYLILALMLGACSAASSLSENAAAPKQARAIQEAPVEGKQNVTSASGDGVAGLPFSHGRSFRTLDEYLAHLERHAAPIDQPWWREIRPGVYEHVKRMPGAPREIATRAELMKRFGFSS